MLGQERVSLGRARRGPVKGGEDVTRPTRWGPWENLGQIGEGGTAHVFEVIHVGTHLHGALKRLKNVERRGRLEAEIKAVASLDHPAIVRLLDWDLEGEQPYAVYELERGGTLADIPNEELLDVPLAQRLQWCQQVCSALGSAHEAGLVHRDVKPENILLSADRGSARLSDFGLVFIDGGERQTATLEQVGSRYYIAPELEDGRAEAVSPSVDIYGLGKVLYYLVSGTVYARERHREPQHDLALLSGDPYLEAVSRVIDHSVAADPALRFSNIQEMERAIMEAEKIITNEWPVEGAAATYKCVFCGVGVYEEVCISSDTLAHNSGYVEGRMTDEYMVFLECPVCGNCQRFKLRRGGERWFPNGAAQLRRQLRG